ncbi:MAG TPA: F0F1 ATP synthase subunit beta, partial [Thermoanaerobaculia bacterium]|nr:F0F1 ATP synthase subunit beta [Thermoanaerobaculia bacterium]
MEKSEKSKYGKVTQVIGSTLDAHFSEDQLPRIYNALRVEVKRTILGEEHEETLWCEVAQHLGGGRVRAVALGSTDGLTRGADILDTGSPVTVPVGEETLGRVFNLLGEPIDGRGP